MLLNKLIYKEIIMNNESTIIDIEEFSKSGEGIPKGQRYRIRIDKTHYEVDSETISGRELLLLAGKTNPEQYMIHQKTRGALVEIDLTDVVDLTKPGLERFITQAKDATEGYQRRIDFKLPSDDQQFLDQQNFKYELVCENIIKRVVIYGYHICPGYNLETVDLYLRIESGYPDVQIDMVYFHPAVQRTDGRAIGALSSEAFDGKQWQRWSRHRTGHNPWRPGIDNLSTHLAQIDHWLKREFDKR